MNPIRLWLTITLVYGAAAVAQTPPDTEQQIAIKELLRVMHYKQQLTKSAAVVGQPTRQMLDSVVHSLAKKNKLTPTQIAEAEKIIRTNQDKLAKQMESIYDDPLFLEAMEGAMSRAYSKHFTTPELQMLVQFYASPVGQKTIDVMPQIMQEALPDLMKLVTARTDSLVSGMAQEVIAQARTEPPVDKPVN